MKLMNQKSLGLYATMTYLLCTPGVLGAAVGTGPNYSQDVHTTRAAFKTSKTLTARDEVADAAAILDSIVSIASTLFDWIQGIDKAQHDSESAFTQGMVTSLRNTYPNKNVIVYHDQDSQTNFVNGVHSHQELNLPDGPETQGYEIYVFDSGTFTLAGDGGYLNWCFAGDYDRDGESTTVTFNTIEDTSVTPPAAPNSVPVAPQTPVREDSSDTDGNYFVNCVNNVDGTTSSGMAYYKNLNPGQNAGQQPDDYVDVIHGSYQTWESVGSVTFPTSGTTVQWSIFGNAGDADVNSSCGTADNGYENFWVYKDAGELLYSVDSWDCSSIYWAF